MRLCLQAAHLSPAEVKKSKSVVSAEIAAAAFGKVRALKTLINAGCDVNANDPSASGSGNTPLHWAVLHHQGEATKLLIDARADVTRRNRTGQSPLDLARESNWEECIQWIAATPVGGRSSRRSKWRRRESRGGEVKGGDQDGVEAGAVGDGGDYGRGEG